ncbi:ubiquitin-like protein 4A [Catharus ustulatus]|uniref:ubiquitin-like protein 4A n=1 Tax=Catharus ustulatus TaxID=91951 RepID=UPI0014072F9D|nr:ubiquitin-like protein 4A [Catharus ustulatus]
MLLTVKALQGRECSLQVSPEERVGALKALVAERLQVPVEQQRLLYRGKALADERRLSDYSIGPSARLNLVLKPPAGGGGARAGGGGGAATPPEDLGEPPPPPPAVFGPGLAQILGRHFGSQEGPRVLQQLLKDYDRSLRGLSLDDLERLGARLLQEGGGGAGGAPPEPRGHWAVTGSTGRSLGSLGAAGGRCEVIGSTGRSLVCHWDHWEPLGGAVPRRRGRRELQSRQHFRL